jgi:hypothetical protein
MFLKCQCKYIKLHVNVFQDDHKDGHHKESGDHVAHHKDHKDDKDDHHKDHHKDGDHVAHHGVTRDGHEAATDDASDPHHEYDSLDSKLNKITARLQHIDDELETRLDPDNKNKALSLEHRIEKLEGWSY